VSATIAVHRSPDIWMDRNHLYKVAIDGHDQGEIWPSQRMPFDVALGEHRVVTKIDFIRSNELT
jgi:hypothetical protein